MPARVEQRVVVRRRGDQPLEELRAAVIVGAAGDDDLERLRVRAGVERERRRGRRHRQRRRRRRRIGAAGTWRAGRGRETVRPGPSFSEKWHQCACGAHEIAERPLHRLDAKRGARRSRGGCPRPRCGAAPPLREVKSTIATRLLDAAVEMPEAEARAAPVVAAPQALALGHRPRRRLVADVADVVREDEVRPIGDRRQQPAEHVVGDVVAVRVPEHQHAGGVADDRVEIGGGDVLLARVEVRPATRAAPAGDRAAASRCASRARGTG